MPWRRAPQNAGASQEGATPKPGAVAGPMWRPRNAGVRGGTMSSNLLCSSGESRANLSLAGIRLSSSRSRGFPRVCGPGRAARSAETRRARQHRADGVISLSGHIPVPHRSVEVHVVVAFTAIGGKRKGVHRQAERALRPDVPKVPEVELEMRRLARYDHSSGTPSLRRPAK